MQGYDVHKAFYRNCEIHGLWVRGLASSVHVRPIWSCSENVLNIFIYIYSMRKYSECMNLMFVKPFTKIVKSTARRTGVEALYFKRGCDKYNRVVNM